jgi:aspartate/methionine/tyrosine aminotransferase
MNTQARTLIEDLSGSLIREVANAGLGKADVLPFWFGESNAPTDARIVQAAITSLEKGETFYSHNMGLAELREAYAAYVNGVHGCALTLEQVAITSAGVNALMVAVQALVSPGDEVVVVEPVWPNLPGQARVMNAQLNIVSLEIINGRWQLDIDKLIAAITPRTRLVMINSPNNPTGWTMPAQQVQSVLEHCRKTGTWILADEVYHRLYTADSDNKRSQAAPSFLEYAHANDRVVVVHSFSKSFWMTGWRLGAMIAPRELMVAIGKLMEFNTSCAPVFVQRAGLAAVLDAERHVANVRAQLKAALPVLLQGLQKLPGAIVPVPDGAMYVFFKLAGFNDSLTTAKRLVSEAGLGLAPGAAFGDSGHGWLRWCYAGSPERMQEGVKRLERWMKTHPAMAA